MAEWELQEMLEELREYAECPDGLTTWLSRTQAAALLALLEVEHCKRRIEATGVFAWTDNMSAEYEHTCPVLVSGVGPLGYQMPVSFGKRCGPSTVADWRAAAEYAEAHAQEVPE